ncbi:hypothetical protein B5P22_31035 [Pseudomonas tolaasii]|uniref:hypothetical protein n=1 Tax=Pseudomonas tolaasii TaxID=29442 RepID=UPI0009B61D86|nr:hypothetical protein [Pseudomonas tolaasii]ARB31542.1 hypothetical protein B5P22_31035 [Pseudomonas tolaasii]
MAVHGIYFTDQHDDTIQLNEMNNWGNCWGAFQNIQRKVEGVVDIHVLIKMPEQFKPIAVKFMESDFFKNLTDNKFHLGQLTPAEFKSSRLVAHHMGPQHYMEVVFKSDLEAARMITAGRLLTSIRYLENNGHGTVRGFKEDQYHLIPLVLNAIHTNGEPYSDSYITFMPLTLEHLREAAGDHKLYDVDVDDDYYDIAQGHYNGARISVEMLKRVLGRTSEDFKERTSQNWGILEREYFKDCEASEWLDDEAIPGDTYVSIGSPVQDVMLDGETALKTTMYEALAQFE